MITAFSTIMPPLAGLWNDLEIIFFYNNVTPCGVEIVMITAFSTIISPLAGLGKIPEGMILL